MGKNNSVRFRQVSYSLYWLCVVSQLNPEPLEDTPRILPLRPLPLKSSPFLLLSAHYCASPLGVDSLLLKKTAMAFGSLKTPHDSRWAYLGRWPRDTAP